MHTPDQHLPAPPLRALDQLGVARRIGQALGRPLREWMRARAEQLHPAIPHDLSRGHQRRPQIVHRLRHRVTHAGDDFDCVAQQFLVHPRVVLAEFQDDRGRLVAQVAGLGVDERELPFDTDSRPG
jgi:hypothetical protein